MKLKPVHKMLDCLKRIHLYMYLSEKEEKESELSWGDQVEELEKSKKEKAAPVSFEEVVVVTCDDNGSVKLWKPLQV